MCSAVMIVAGINVFCCDVVAGINVFCCDVVAGINVN